MFCNKINILIMFCNNLSVGSLFLNGRTTLINKNENVSFSCYRVEIIKPHYTEQYNSLNNLIVNKVRVNVLIIIIYKYPEISNYF